MFAYTPDAVAMEEVRDASQPPLTGLESLVRKRLFLVYADNLAKDESAINYDRATVENIFKRDGIPQEDWGNSMMCRRAVVFYAIQKDPIYAIVWKPVAGMFTSFKDYYDECLKYKAKVDPITVDRFSKALYFLGDLSKIVGYGRDSKSGLVTSLKKLLQDCNRAAVVFVLYSRSMDGINDLLSGLRYAIFDAPDSKDWARLRTEAPGSLGNKLSVLYDVLDNRTPQRKFKRTLLQPEI